MDNVKLVIFAFNNTLVKTISGDTFQRDADDCELIAGRREKILEMNARGGVHFAIATNQGGVAFGHLSPLAITATICKIAEEIGCIEAKGIFTCFTHPSIHAIDEWREINDPRRMPNPGMLQEAMQLYGADPWRTLFVGTRPEDKAAADNAHCNYMLAKEFFPERNGQ